MDENLHVNSRLGFIKKVYGIVGTQLSVTALWTTAVCVTPALHNFVVTSNFIFILTLIAGLVSTCCLAFSKHMRNTVPINYFLLAVATLASAYSVSISVAYYPGEIIAQALVITAAVVAGITIYAWSATTTFNSLRALVICSLSLFVANLLLRLVMPSDMFHWTIYLLSGLLAGLSLLYQLQAVFGKKDFKYESDDYILASLNVYYDVVDLFLTILKVLNALQNKDQDKKDKKKKQNPDL